MPNDPFFTEHASSSGGGSGPQPLMGESGGEGPPFLESAPPFRLLTPKQIYQVRELAG